MKWEYSLYNLSEVHGLPLMDRVLSSERYRAAKQRFSVMPLMVQITAVGSMNDNGTVHRDDPSLPAEEFGIPLKEMLGASVMDRAPAAAGRQPQQKRQQPTQQRAALSEAGNAAIDNYLRECLVVSVQAYEHLNSFPCSMEWSFSPHSQSTFVSPFSVESRSGPRERVLELHRTFRAVEPPYELSHAFRFHSPVLSTVDFLHHRRDIRRALVGDAVDPRGAEDVVTVFMGPQLTKTPVRMVYVDKNKRYYPVLRNAAEQYIRDAVPSAQGDGASRDPVAERVVRGSEDPCTWRVESLLLERALGHCFVPVELAEQFHTQHGGLAHTLWVKLRVFDLRRRNASIVHPDNDVVERACGIKLVILVVLPVSAT